jgi:large subunit ribosomal protein L18e
MKASRKNPQLRAVVEQLQRKACESDAAFWKALARGLERPRRIRREVDVGRLEKHARAKETVAVPGVVLSTGELSKPLTVAALRFTPAAREKIEKAGGKCLTLDELLGAGKASKVRIMG